jgi:hypothetical protein
VRLDLAAQAEHEPALGQELQSLASTARFIGLRAKATAMPVPNSSFSVAAAPMAMGRNGSCAVSADHTPSYPLASALRAASAIPSGRTRCPVDLHARTFP